MPVYEYICPECGFEVTGMRSVANRDDAPLCVRHIGDGHPPEVRRVRMKRRVSRSTGIVLKGGGWAKDGYGKGGQ